MAIDWNKTILVCDENTVDAICGKEILYVRGTNNGGGGGGSHGYIVSATKVRTEGTTDYYLLEYSDGVVIEAPFLRNAGIFTGGGEINGDGSDSRLTIEYESDVDAAVSEMTLIFSAAQEGSGTPSSENIRPFIPVDGLDIFLSSDLNLLTKLKSNLDPTEQSTGVIVSQASGGQVIFERWNDLTGTEDFEDAAEYELYLPAGTYYLFGARIDTQGGGAYCNIRLDEYGTGTNIAGQDYGDFDQPYQFTLAAEKHLLLKLHLYNVNSSVYTTHGQEILRTTVALFRDAYYENSYSYYTVKNYCGIQGGQYHIAFPADTYGGTFDLATGELRSRAKHITAYTGTPDLRSYNWRSDRDEYVFGTNPTLGAEVIYDAAPIETILPLPYDGPNIFAKDANLIDYALSPDEPDFHYFNVRADSDCLQSLHGEVNYYIPFTEIFSGTLREAPDDGGYYVRHDKQWVDMSSAGNASFHVNGSTGDDSNPGTTSAKPFKTLEKALSVLPYGRTTTIYIAPGTYTHASEYGAFSVQGKKVMLYANGGQVILGSSLILDYGAWVELLGTSGASFKFNASVNVRTGSTLLYPNGVLAGIYLNNGNSQYGLTASDSSHVCLWKVSLMGEATRVELSNGSHGFFTFESNAVVSATYGSIIGYVKNPNTLTITESTSGGGRIFTGSQS